MTKAEIKGRALEELSPGERRELGAELRESSGEADAASIPDGHWPLVAEALAEHERDPAGALPGEELLDWLRRPRT